MKENEVVELMRSATSEDDWNTKCDYVKGMNEGKYPDFWYSAIVLSGVFSETKATWK